jgi:hypothetical protein
MFGGTAEYVALWLKTELFPPEVRALGVVLASLWISRDQPTAWWVRQGSNL